LKERTAAKARRTMARGEASPLALPGAAVVELADAPVSVLEEVLEPVVLVPVVAAVEDESVAVVVTDPVVEADVAVESVIVEPLVEDPVAAVGEAVAPISWNCVPKFEVVPSVIVIA